MLTRNKRAQEHNLNFNKRIGTLLGWDPVTTGMPWLFAEEDYELIISYGKWPYLRVSPPIPGIEDTDNSENEKMHQFSDLEMIQLAEFVIVKRGTGFADE